MTGPAACAVSTAGQARRGYLVRSRRGYLVRSNGTPARVSARCTALTCRFRMVVVDDLQRCEAIWAETINRSRSQTFDFGRPFDPTQGLGQIFGDSGLFFRGQ